MNKKVIFDVELSNGQCTSWLSLPASDYDLLDTLDELRIEPPDAPEWKNIYYDGFSELPELLKKAGDIYEVNALAKVMASYDSRQETALEAFIKGELDKQPNEVPMETIYDLACSVKNCHVLNLQTDEQLGRFYVENGLIPELSKEPEQILKMIDYAKIGRKMRKDEGGVFASGQYFTQAEGLKKVYCQTDFTLRKPDYAAALEVSVMDDPECNILLKLPLSDKKLEASISQFEMEDICYRCIECRIPMLASVISRLDNLELANEAAQQIANIPRELLPRYKALVEALDGEAKFPLPSEEEILREYTFVREYAEPSDVAKEKLSIVLGDEEANILFPHTNLHGYGKALIEWENAKLTSYGLIERTDYYPILAEEQTQSGMQML